jgi:hypothetical protein
MLESIQFSTKDYIEVKQLEKLYLFPLIETNLMPPLFIEVPVINQKSERSWPLFIEVPVINQKGERSWPLFIEVPVINQKGERSWPLFIEVPVIKPER